MSEAWLTRVDELPDAVVEVVLAFRDGLAEGLAGEVPVIGEVLHENPVYATLNLCRVAYSVETRDVVVSKLRAGHWALDHLDARWHALIEAALAGYEGRSGEAGRLRLIRDLDGFHAYAADRIRRTAEANA